MKAVRVHEFGGPERLVVEDVPDPAAGQGQVVVRLHAAGVNPVDTYIRTGTHAVKPPLPYTPGFDAAGVVASVGAGVTRWAAGDRVYVAGSVSGTYAEYALCQESQVHPLPDRATFGQGAALGIPYVTAYRALFQLAHVRPGESLLVHGGSGGVGIAAIQLARAAGLTVIATAGSDEGRALVRQQGAHHALDHHAGDIAAQLSTLTAGRGIDVILEMLANKNLGADLQYLARRGRVVVVGSRGPVEINPRDLMSREAAVFGALVFGASVEDLASAHAALLAGLEAGSVRPVVGTEMPLAHVRQAHEAILQPGHRGKIVLTA